MNTSRANENGLLYLLVAGGAIAIVLICWAIAPWWAVIIVAILLIGMAIALQHANRRAARLLPSKPAVALVAGSPAQRREQAIVDVLMPSRRADYSFLFSATVVWTPARDAIDDSSVNMGALAVSAILRRACRLTEERDPAHVSLVEHQLASDLGGRQPDHTGRLYATAEAVRLTLPEDDRHRLDKLATVRKDKDVWEHERIYEQNRREYLRTDVLKDPGSAVIWWLSKNENAVEKTVNDIGLLTRLSSVANNGAVPEVFRPYLSDATEASRQPFLPMFDDAAQAAPVMADMNGTPTDRFGAFLRAASFDDADPERRLFARRVAQLLTKHDRHAVAAELIERFDPDEPGPPAADPEERP